MSNLCKPTLSSEAEISAERPRVPGLKRHR